MGSLQTFQFLHRIPHKSSGYGYLAVKIVFQFLHRIPPPRPSRPSDPICAIFQFLHRIPHGLSAHGGVGLTIFFQFLHRIPQTSARLPEVLSEMLSIPSPDSTSTSSATRRFPETVFQFLHRIPRFHPSRERRSVLKLAVFQFLHRIPQNVQ